MDPTKTSQSHIVNRVVRGWVTKPKTGEARAACLRRGSGNPRQHAFIEAEATTRAKHAFIEAEASKQ